MTTYTVPGMDADAEFDALDQVSQDLLLGQLERLEKYQWFVRAHLENAGGEIPSAAARTERGAAEAVGDAGHT